MEIKKSIIRKKYIVYTLLLIITFSLVFFALKNSSSTPFKTSSTPTPTVHVVNKTATIYFNPSSLSASSLSPHTVDIMVDTGKSSVTAVQIELQYDPKVITDMKITPTTDSKSLFGESGTISLINKVDPVKGIIQYAIGVSPDATPKTGVGTLLTLTFNTSGLQKSTEITFVPQTLVTTQTEVESILKNTVPLKIEVK